MATFVLTIRTKDSGDIRRMRWLLKRMLRTYGWRCLAVKEVEAQK